MRRDLLSLGSMPHCWPARGGREEEPVHPSPHGRKSEVDTLPLGPLPHAVFSLFLLPRVSVCAQWLHAVLAHALE